MKNKKKRKVLGVHHGSFETYTKYCWVANEKQKKTLEVFYGSF